MVVMRRGVSSVIATVIMMAVTLIIPVRRGLELVRVVVVSGGVYQAIAPGNW